MLIDLSCPVENRGAIVKTNSETCEPYVLLKLLNISEKTITSIKFDVLAYDSNGTLLATIPVELNELSAVPKNYFAENKAISGTGIEDAKNFIIDVKSATFEDESVYEPSEENTVDADDKEASVDDVLAIRHFVPEAVCFAKEHKDYYRCVCGRPNFLDSENCVRCGRAKDDLLKNFVSIESINALLEEEKLIEEKKIAEENERLLAEKELKKKKTKKALLISAISLVAAVILAIAGYFAYITYLNISADKAMENGDYVKAFENYQKTGNDKISEAIQKAQGNTPGNLLFQIGLLADDEENSYYLAQDNTSHKFNLIKENKATKEKVTLTDAAGSALNVTKDWIYFISAEDGFVKRISKDGQTIETVLETQVAYLSVIGDTVFFLKTDYDNPGNLTEEQCAVLVSQGQMKSYQHLYKMNINKKEPKLICNDDMVTCAIYDGRIYFLTKSENQWESYNLYSVNLKGENKKVIVDKPAASFAFYNDEIYYVNMYKPEYEGQEINDFSMLDYTIYRKNINTGEEILVTDSYLPVSMNAFGSKLCFIAYDRAVYTEAQNNPDAELTPAISLYVYDIETGATRKLIEGGLQWFSMYNDDIVAYVSPQGMCRIKTDGTGYEDLSPVVEVEEESEETEITE